MSTFFNELKEVFLFDEVVKVIMRVSIFDEFEGDQTAMTIEAVLEGNTELNGETFYLENNGVELDSGPYEAELKVGWYEDFLIPEINCLNFNPTKRG